MSFVADKIVMDGLTYDEVSADDQGRLDDAIIHATIIKQELPYTWVFPRMSRKKR